jgi:hypothetical protein
METIENIVMMDETWCAITSEVITNGISSREQIKASGQQIVGCVTANRLSAEDLRSCARWTGMLAHEAAQAAKQGSELSNEDQLEIVARHILHGSISAALNKVKTDGRLVTQRAKALQQSRWQRSRAGDTPGMGRSELKGRRSKRFAE